MAKSEKKLSPQITRFETPLSDGELAAGLLLKSALNKSLYVWLRTSPTNSRYTVAAELSRLTGRDIIKNTIDQDVAESKEEYRLPAELLAAWCFITRSFEPITIFTAPFGYHLLSPEEWDRIELARLLEEQARIEGKIQKAKARLMNG
jgi:hypothetical protein